MCNFPIKVYVGCDLNRAVSLVAAVTIFSVA